MTEKKMGWMAGWKRIAEYCDVTEQTAKKYVSDLEMPVTRIGNKVFAIPSDLDMWLRKKNLKNI